MEKDILNLEEAVVLLKTSKPTFYRWIREGRIKGFKMGREWRFYKSDLTGFMESTDQDKEVIKRELRQAIAFYDERANRRRETTTEKSPRKKKK